MARLGPGISQPQDGAQRAENVDFEGDLMVENMRNMGLNSKLNEKWKSELLNYRKNGMPKRLLQNLAGIYLRAYIFSPTILYLPKNKREKVLFVFLASPLINAINVHQLMNLVARGIQLVSTDGPSLQVASCVSLSVARLASSAVVQ